MKYILKWAPQWKCVPLNRNIGQIESKNLTLICVTGSFCFQSFHFLREFYHIFINRINCQTLRLGWDTQTVHLFASNAKKNCRSAFWRNNLAKEAPAHTLILYWIIENACYWARNKHLDVHSGDADCFRHWCNYPIRKMLLRKQRRIEWMPIPCRIFQWNLIQLRSPIGVQKTRINLCCFIGNSFLFSIERTKIICLIIAYSFHPIRCELIIIITTFVENNNTYLWQLEINLFVSLKIWLPSINLILSLIHLHSWTPNQWGMWARHICISYNGIYATALLLAFVIQRTSTEHTNVPCKSICKSYWSSIPSSSVKIAQHFDF